MSGIRAVLFDFNGVLLDDEAVHYQLFQEVLREQGIELTEQHYYRELIAYDDERVFEKMWSGCGRELLEDQRDELIERKARYYLERMQRDGFPFFPGAVSLVRAVKDAGWGLGIVSGALRREIEGALEQEGLLELVDTIVAAEDVVESKPAPEGYERGLAEIRQILQPVLRLAANTAPSLTARDVVAIEDTNEGLSAARSAGLRTIGVAQTLEAAELRADWVVEEISDLEVSMIGERFG